MSLHVHLFRGTNRGESCEGVGAGTYGWRAIKECRCGAEKVMPSALDRMLGQRPRIRRADGSGTT